MTLDLSPYQPPEEASVPDSAPAAPVLATLVTMDAVVVRISERPDGTLIVQPGSRNPIMFDRHQAGALRAALAEG